MKHYFYYLLNDERIHDNLIAKNKLFKNIFIFEKILITKINIFV